MGLKNTQKRPNCFARLYCSFCLSNWFPSATLALTHTNEPNQHRLLSGNHVEKPLPIRSQFAFCRSKVIFTPSLSVWLNPQKFLIIPNWFRWNCKLSRSSLVVSASVANLSVSTSASLTKTSATVGRFHLSTTLFLQVGKFYDVFFIFYSAFVKRFGLALNWTLFTRRNHFDPFYDVHAFKTFTSTFSTQSSVLSLHKGCWHRIAN